MHLCNLMRWLVSISSDISTNQGKITFVLGFKNLIQSLYLVQREDFHFSPFQREDFFFFQCMFSCKEGTFNKCIMTREIFLLYDFLKEMGIFSRVITSLTPPLPPPTVIWRFKLYRTLSCLVFFDSAWSVTAFVRCLRDCTASKMQTCWNQHTNHLLGTAARSRLKAVDLINYLPKIPDPYLCPHPPLLSFHKTG